MIRGRPSNDVTAPARIPLVFACASLRAVLVDIRRLCRGADVVVRLCEQAEGLLVEIEAHGMKENGR